VSLSIKCIDDFIEAHQVTHQGQILAIACLIGVCECAGHDVAKFGNVAHVNSPHSWIDSKSPAEGSAWPLLRSDCARQVLVEKRCDDERMMDKTGFLHDPIDLGLAGKVGNIELADC